MKKLILYWSPCLNPVGTVKSTINSATSLSKYSKKFKVKLINTCGEWNNYRNYCLNNKIEYIDFGFNFFNLLPKVGFLKSRFSYILIIFFSIIPLIKVLIKQKPDYIILHLLTSLPLILLNIFPFKTKFILRISGYPKLTLLRSALWKLSSKKLFAITTPTKQLLETLKHRNIFEERKLFFLPDAILNLSEFRIKIKDNNNISSFVPIKNFFLSIGRFTKQKNFLFLIKEFYKFSLENNDYHLVIIGDGEDKKLIQKFVKEKKIENRVHLFGYTDNVYYYMKKANAFILSSLWEDPGFVIIESALSNLYIISSDCPNGPSEFLLHGKAGSIFSNNSENELYIKLKEFCKLGENEIFLKKILAKKNAKLFTIYSHFNILNKIIY